jgi:hypothetical protein
MYDVPHSFRTLILKGGLETHHLAVCSHGVQNNPYYCRQLAIPSARLKIQFAL